MRGQDCSLHDDALTLDTDNRERVEKGERIAHGIFVKIGKFEWEEVEKMESPDRGGFGSTG